MFHATGFILFPEKRQLVLKKLVQTCLLLRLSYEHNNHSKQYSLVLRDAKLSFKLKKGNFFTKSVDYCGHVTRFQVREIASDITDTITGVRSFTSLTEHCSAFKLCNVFHRFELNFARIAALANNKSRKGHPKTVGALTAKELSAMLELQKTGVVAMIVLPNTRWKGALDTSGCMVQVECVFIKKLLDGTTKRAETWLQSLTDSE